MPIPQKWVLGNRMSGSDWNDVRLYGTPDYIVFNENGLTYAYGQFSGSTDYSGSNSATVIESAIADATTGSTIFLKVGTYLPFTVSKSVNIVGEGIQIDTPDPGIGDPDEIPTNVHGAIVQVTTASTDGITLSGNLTGVSFKNLAIEFSGSGTGNGIYSNPGADAKGLMYCTLENIVVYNHDADHYAFYLSNMQHNHLDMLFSFGGPAFYFDTNSTNILYGNCVLGELYARTKSGLNISKDIVMLSGSTSSILWGSSTFSRLQIMDRATTTGYALHIKNCNSLNFYQLDIEEPASLHAVKMEDSTWVTVQNALITGGDIVHTATTRCGYYGGEIHCYGYAFTSTGTDDFVNNVSVLGTGSYTGFNGNYTQEVPSYIIYMSGNTCYAKNGSTGNIDYSSTDATYVIQSVLNQAKTGSQGSQCGENIFFKQGLYQITGSLQWHQDCVSITGENHGAEIRASGSLTGHMFIISGSRFAHFDNLFINGYGIASTCINAEYGSSRVPMHKIENCKLWGATGSCVNYTNCEDSMIYNCWFDGRKNTEEPPVCYAQYGLQIGNTATNGDIHVYNSYIGFNKIADVFLGNVQDINFYGCVFTSKPSYDGATDLEANIIIAGGSNNYPKVLFDGCWWDGNLSVDPSWDAYDIKITNPSSELIINKCYMNSTSGSNIYAAPTTNPALEQLTILGGFMQKCGPTDNISLYVEDATILNTRILNVDAYGIIDTTKMDRYFIKVYNTGSILVKSNLELANDKYLHGKKIDGTSLQLLGVYTDDIIHFGTGISPNAIKIDNPLDFQNAYGIQNISGITFQSGSEISGVNIVKITGSSTGDMIYLESNSVTGRPERRIVSNQANFGVYENGTTRWIFDFSSGSQEGGSGSGTFHLYDNLISEPSGSSATAVSGIAKVMHVVIDGTTYYIPCYTGASA